MIILFFLLAAILIVAISALVTYLTMRSAVERAKLAAEVAGEKAKLDAQAWLTTREEEIRKDAIARSVVTVRGKVAEQLAPFAAEFEYNPRDTRFLGSPIDLLVFDGLDEGEVDAIYFIEVKTGSSALSSKQLRVKEAVERGSVYFEELRLGGQDDSRDQAK